MSFLAALGPALFQVGVAEAAEPEETVRPAVSLSLIEDAEARYYVGEAVDDPYFEQVSRTNLLITGKGWTAGAQIDEVVVAGTTYVDSLGIETQAVDLLAPEMRFPLDNSFVHPEKLYLTGRRGVAELTVGDSYSTFGRGIALDIARRTDIDVDTSLLGARLSADGERWSFQALSGLVNAQQVNQDNRNAEIDPGLAHVVSGARGELWGLGPLDLGVHAVSFTLAPTNDFGFDWTRYADTPSAAIGGANMSADVLGGDLEWFLEVDRLVPVTAVAQEDPLVPGWAAYSSLTAYGRSLVVLVEAKRYLAMEDINRLALSDGYELLTPPTLEYERVITEDSSAAVNSSDIYGARVRVDWTAVPGRTLPYASVAVFRDLAWDDGLHFNETPETIVHPVLGLQQFGLGGLDGSHVFANAGLRVDRRDPGVDGTDAGADVQAHADLDIGPWPEERGLELALAFERFLWGDNAFQQTDYTELEGALSWHAADRVVLVAYVDYSDNPLVKGGAFGSPGNLGEDTYGALEIQVKPNPRMTLKAFYGAYKAGVRCAGGQCKQLPAFEGARLSANFRL